VLEAAQKKQKNKALWDLSMIYFFCFVEFPVSSCPRPDKPVSFRWKFPYAATASPAEKTKAQQ